MALQTFLNLKEDRQEEVLWIAYEEFALNGYDSASLSEIIKRCNLAKGSFYRYFSNKKELYAYLIKDATTRRLKQLDKMVQNESIDFFDLLLQNFMNKIQFDLEFPLIGGFLYKIMHEKDNNEVADIIRELTQDIIDRTIQILKAPHFNLKVIDNDYQMVAFHIFQMQIWLYDYVGKVYRIDFENCIKFKEPIITVGTEELETIVKRAIRILKIGIVDK